ncbi:MAG: type II toxin-antitoxin system HicB family antitoxin [Prevotella sp.]|jgi:predicted RNase H-like HicB family nuclease|nr:type II toxin-antitoxin system HicB family antitoxin [Prevotella sp.]
MKHLAVIELWDEGTYSIYVPDMDKHSLNAQGKSVEEAKQNLSRAILDYKNMYNEIGKPVPAEIDNPIFEYKYDLASFFDYFDWINVSKLAVKAKINASLMRQYKNRITFASEKQTVKIQETIHELGKELAAVRL